ncbi:MAG: hypothetical protein CVT99_15200 [Bacteroidetes bacterium HGW-Bacteroidetes-16]|jgi:hypothetical protein|nr:MAG: hypothetical protein CVT99_15200 [Bacteroidetes bacterium HGW-Bacteroidetes-16]
MKKAILLPLAFLIIFLNSSKAQQYYPFQTDTAKWSVTSWVNNYPNGFSYETNFYFINGDTLFNDLTYSKIYRNNPLFTNLIDTANSTYIGALREANYKHIYFKPATVNQIFSMHCQINNSNLDEFLLYRFDVVLGEEFELNEFVGGTLEVLNVDSVLVDTYYRKLIRLGIGGINVEWIEGIGEMTSLFGTFCPMFESGDNLLCYEDPGTFYFGPLNSYGRCTDFVVGQDEISRADLVLYPNPAGKTVHINNLDGRPISQILFYDQLGHLVWQLTNPSESIDVSTLRTGMYIVELASGNFRYRKKFIIER